MCKGVLSSHNDWHFVVKNQRIMTAVLEKVPYKGSVLPKMPEHSHQGTLEYKLRKEKTYILR